jgi:ElaB/YqjD/DUF883 family membrane-anchored ribosome-binding protein
MNDDLTNEPTNDMTNQSSPAELERDIERTRERMSSNIDELGERLSPDNLKRQAKEAITGKAHDVAANVGGQARDTGGRVLDFITENPLPVAAVTLGAIWLFSMRKGGQREVSGDRMARFAYTGPERREPNGGPGLGRRLVDRAESLRERVGEKASHAGERVGELTGRVQDRAGELGMSARERARDAQGGLERLLGENPLAVAAGAAFIGLALGMLVPETDSERRVMGPTRDQLADRAQDVVDRVKDVAADAGREVKETVRSEVAAVTPQMKDSVQGAVSAVKEQVKESAGRVAEEAKQEARRPRSTQP